MVPQVLPESEGTMSKSLTPGGGDRDGQSFLRHLPGIVTKTILRKARVLGVAWLYQAACIRVIFENNQVIIWQRSKSKGARLGDGA